MVNHPLEEWSFGPILAESSSGIPVRFPNSGMARWPRHFWTSIFTYGVIFVMFPVLCWLAYAWVQGWLF
jgi:hypothetical protein